MLSITVKHGIFSFSSPVSPKLFLLLLQHCSGGVSSGVRMVSDNNSTR